MGRLTFLRTALVWAALALATPTSLWAQRYTFRQYGSGEGLTNLSINCLLQDRTGYIWIGTDNGLFQYDGGRFQEFGHAEGLPNTEILSLTESPEGVLWVATQSGLAYRSGRQFTPVEVGERGQIRSVAFDAGGRVYLKHNSGLVRGVRDSAGAFQFQTVVHGVIRGLLVDGQSVWFGKDDDLWRLSGEKTERIGSPAGLPADLWNTIVQDTSGNLWVRSPTRLYELPKGQPRFVNRSEGIPFAPNSRLYADRHGRLFVSSDAGVVILDGVSRTHIDFQHGLPAEGVGPVLLDREESLWLGLVGGGLARRLGHGEWLSWKKEDGLLHNAVWAIQHDRGGHVWVGTSGGLSILGPDGRASHSWTSRNGLAGDRVLAIVQGPAGDFFVGTDPPGISRFSRQRVLLRTYRSDSGFTAERVNSLAFDRQGRLWAVGRGGCFRSRESLTTAAEAKFERVDVPTIPAQTYFYAVTVDEKGVVWIASSLGLARFDGNRWRVFTERDGLKSVDLGAIVQGQGALWLSYRDALGITRLQFDGEQVKATHFTKHEGLFSDQVYALAFDQAGRLWATSDSGVDVLEEGHWRHYDREDGLIWDDTDSLALHVDTEGNVWVGTSGGLSRYTSPPYPIPDSPPTVVLTSIEGVAQRFQATDEPVLPHAQSSLAIRSGTLSYSYETRTRFRYRLSGYEKEWHETRERSVHFAGLPAGHYIFEEVAAGPNGLWSTVPTRFAFSVKPAWWQTWWFVTTCALIILLLGRALWRLRVRTLMSQKERLERQVDGQTAELRQSRQQLWAAMDAAKLGIFSQSLINGENFGDEQIQSIFGTAPGELITFEKLLSFVLPEDRERFARIVAQGSQLPEEADPTFEYRTNLPDGSIRWLQVRGGIIRDGFGKSMRAAGIVMDITEQKRAEHEMRALEQQLRQAQKMEAVGRLAGGMAHDFNNLLMVIQSYTEMLQDNLSEDDSLRRNTEQVLKAADRGASLTKQLLAFSRKQVISPIVLDLNATVSEAAKMLKRLIGEDVELRVTASEALWAVKADPDQIAQVLVNLCVNARDAMPRGGSITIATGNVTMEKQLLESYPDVIPGNYVMLSVTDTGTGISKEVQEQMFEPFFTTKERGKGTGLGLSTVFGIVKQSGGYVWAESELGRGACFTVYLPRVDVAIAPLMAAKTEVGPRGTETVLVAEDEEALREAMCSYLRGLGYAVLDASSGPQAIMVASQHQARIDLLVTDVIMPKMSGRELSQKLASQRPDLKTIYMSGYTDDAVVRYGVREEGVAFLQKPFSLITLTRKVREMLGSTEVLS